MGKFGGSGENALARIMGKISLRLPVLSNFACESAVFQEDAARFAQSARERFSQFDVAYFDPPYNQHPYGSNYFMLNLITDFINEGKRPNAAELSRVSGIPAGWNRSAYNKKSSAAEEFFALLAEFPAKFLIISFNSEGFISKAEFLKNRTHDRDPLSDLPREQKFKRARALRDGIFICRTKVRLKFAASKAPPKPALCWRAARLYAQI